MFELYANEMRNSDKQIQAMYRRLTDGLHQAIGNIGLLSQLAQFGLALFHHARVSGVLLRGQDISHAGLLPLCVAVSVISHPSPAEAHSLTSSVVASRPIRLRACC